MGTNWIFTQAIKNEEGVTPAYYLEYYYKSWVITSQPDYKPPESDDRSAFVNFILLTLTYVIVFTNLLPISMMVQLELIKLIQSTFMSYDKDMI